MYLAMSATRFNVLGKVTPRKDGMARVTGQERYVSDVTLPRMLHGRVLSSPYAHARVKNVDTRAAEALGAVCITFADIPKVRYNERIVTAPWVLHKDHYVLAEKVRYSINRPALENLVRVFGAFFDPARIKPRRPVCGPQGALVPIGDINIAESESAG